MTQRTLLVDSTDLRSLSGLTLMRADLLIPRTPRGSHDPNDGAQGLIGAELPLDAYSFTVLVEIAGSSEFEMLSRFRALATAVKGTNGLVALERRLPSGASTTENATCNGAFAGFTDLKESSANTAIQASMQFINLDGAWSTDGGTTWLDS